MTWSFNDNLAAAKDQVRFLCGDVDTTDQLVSDEVIAGTLAMYGSVHRAGAAVCRHLSARFSRQADIAEDDLSKSLSQRASAFADRAKELDDVASSGLLPSAVPALYAGGLSIADKQSQRQDTDRVPPLFTRDQLDFPETHLLNTTVGSQDE